MPRMPFISKPMPVDTAYRDSVAMEAFEGLKAAYIKRRLAGDAVLQAIRAKDQAEREAEAVELQRQGQELG